MGVPSPFGNDPLSLFFRCRPRFQTQLHHSPGPDSVRMMRGPFERELGLAYLSCEERCQWFQSTYNLTIIVLLEVESHPHKVKT